MATKAHFNHTRLEDMSLSEPEWLHIETELELARRQLPDWAKPGQWVRDTRGEMAPGGGIACIRSTGKASVLMSNGALWVQMDDINKYLEPVKLKAWTPEHALEFVLSGKAVYKEDLKLSVTNSTMYPDGSFMLSLDYASLVATGDDLIAPENMYRTEDHRPCGEIVP